MYPVTTLLMKWYNCDDVIRNFLCHYTSITEIIWGEKFTYRLTKFHIFGRLANTTIYAWIISMNYVKFKLFELSLPETDLVTRDIELTIFYSTCVPNALLFLEWTGGHLERIKRSCTDMRGVCGLKGNVGKEGMERGEDHKSTVVFLIATLVVEYGRL